MSTSAGWDGVLDGIINEEECDLPDNERGYAGNCGSATIGITYLLSYLVISFLIVINMYIAVILENYSQVRPRLHRVNYTVCSSATLSYNYNILNTLSAGNGGCAGRADGRRLRHVLRDLAAVRPGRHSVHSLRPAVRLPGRARAAAADTQAQQIQDHIDGHSDMSRRHDVLRGHPRRAHQGLLRAEGEPDRGDGGPGSGPARRGRLRAGVVDAVAAARGVLRAADPARLATAPARALGARHDGRRGRRRVGGVGSRGPRRAHGRAAGRRHGQRAPRGAAGGGRGAAAAGARAAARARLTRAGARAAARAGGRRAAAAARTAARALEPTQAHLIIFYARCSVYIRRRGGGGSRRSERAAPLVDVTLLTFECWSVLYSLKLTRLLFCDRCSRAFTVFIVSIRSFSFVALDVSR